MAKSQKNSKQVNCVSDCINVLNKHVCQKKCGKIRTNASFECTVDCVNKNNTTGSSRKTCGIKCKEGKKEV